MWFYLMIVSLLLVLIWLTQVRESFIDLPTEIDLSKIPEPQKLMKQMRGLLDKYDKPEVWNHMTQVMDKDPGQLARQHLGINN